MRSLSHVVLMLVAVSVVGVMTQEAPKAPPMPGPLGFNLMGPTTADPQMSSYPLTANDKGGLDETGPYTVQPGFFKPKFPAGWQWGRTAGVWAETPDRIYVYTTGIIPEAKRARPGGTAPQLGEGRLGYGPTNASLRREHILTIFNGKGEVIDEWTHVDALHGPGALPHRVRISPYDPEKHVWLVDEGVDQILKFTHDGKLVMTVKGPRHPAEIAFLPNGDFYTVEGAGLGNDIIKFNKDGKEIMRFGGTGPEPGHLDAAHCLAVDRKGRIYVGEVGNQRVQVFDPTGKSVDIWPGFRSTNFCAIDSKDHFWYFDGNAERFSEYDLNGHILYHWGVAGTYPGRFYNVNQFSVDSEGNLYTAEVVGDRVQKFTPKKWHRDAAHIIPPLFQ